MLISTVPSAKKGKERKNKLSPVLALSYALSSMSSSLGHGQTTLLALPATSTATDATH